MNTLELLETLRKMALQNQQLRQALLETKDSLNPLTSFCEIARAQGIDIYEMDLIQAGEEFYALCAEAPMAEVRIHQCWMGKMIFMNYFWLD